MDATAIRDVLRNGDSQDFIAIALTAYPLNKRKGYKLNINFHSFLKFSSIKMAAFKSSHF